MKETKGASETSQGGRAECVLRTDPTGLPGQGRMQKVLEHVNRDGR